MTCPQFSAGWSRTGPESARGHRLGGRVMGVGPGQDQLDRKEGLRPRPRRAPGPWPPRRELLGLPGPHPLGRRLRVRLPRDAPLLGQQSSQRRSSGQPASAPLQGRVDRRPGLVIRADDRPGTPIGPAPGRGAVGIGPSQDPLDVQRRPLLNRRTRRHRPAPARRSRCPGPLAHDLAPRRPPARRPAPWLYYAASARPGKYGLSPPSLGSPCMRTPLLAASCRGGNRCRFRAEIGVVSCLPRDVLQFPGSWGSRPPAAGRNPTAFTVPIDGQGRRVRPISLAISQRLEPRWRGRIHADIASITARSGPFGPRRSDHR